MNEDTNVLVVEDDESIRQLYADALTAGGIKAITAADGKTGVELALEKHPEVILMDITLPDISGHEAVRKIRNDVWGRTAKVIYLTNSDKPDDVYNAVKQKTVDYIIKANTEIKDVVNLVRQTMYT